MIFKLARISLPANPSVKSPPNPPLIKGSCEKIQWREAKAFLVVRGRGRFLPAKPGGRRLTKNHFPDFRRATPATCEYFYRTRMVTISVLPSSIPRRPRREERLFWRRESAPPPDMARPSISPLPEFFHSFWPRGGERAPGTKSPRADFSSGSPAPGWSPAVLPAPPAKRACQSDPLFHLDTDPAAPIVIH